MKITKTRLRNIIKEELERALNEQTFSEPLDQFLQSHFQQPGTKTSRQIINSMDRETLRSYFNLVRKTGDYTLDKKPGFYNYNNGNISIVVLGDNAEGEHHMPFEAMVSYADYRADTYRGELSDDDLYSKIINTLEEKGFERTSMNAPMSPENISRLTVGRSSRF